MEVRDLNLIEQECINYLIAEERRSHPEETEFLSDEEVLLRTPMTEEDLQAFIYMDNLNKMQEIKEQIKKILLELKDIEEDIAFNEQEIATSRISSIQVSELKRENSFLRGRVFVLNQMLKDLQEASNRGKVENEQFGSR